jgi:UDP-N-acetyl-D-mannosaminuronic acid dehydrogenase
LTVCFLGLSFKANVGDVRNSPALDIVKGCVDLDIDILVVDPHVTKLPLVAENLKAAELEDAIKAADLVVLLVDHKEFSEAGIREMLKNHKNLIDTRGVV